MGVRRVSLSSDSDASGTEEADSQVGPQRSAASFAASSEPDVEMDPGAQFLEAIACPQSDFTYELDGGISSKKMDLAENVSTIGSTVSLVTPELVILALTPLPTRPVIKRVGQSGSCSLDSSWQRVAT